MKKLMLDTNAFDKLLFQEESWLKIADKIKEDYEFYVCDIQIRELANIPDNKKDIRLQDFIALCSLEAKLVPSICVLGYSILGLSCLATDEEAEIYKEIQNNDEKINKNKNNKDAIIGATAYREGCTIVTNDGDFFRQLEKMTMPVMHFEEMWSSFMKYIHS